MQGGVATLAGTLEMKQDHMPVGPMRAPPALVFWS